MHVCFMSVHTENNLCLLTNIKYINSQQYFHLDFSFEISDVELLRDV